MQLEMIIFVTYNLCLLDEPIQQSEMCVELDVSTMRPHTLVKEVVLECGHCSRPCQPIGALPQLLEHFQNFM